MRYGASIFLGLVQAELADHGDCARYQITCPVCHEAVFKGVLTRHDGRETHYFSHYREVPSAQAERCELRVWSITKQQAEQAKAEARGQALAIFVARFQECVLRSGDFDGCGPFAALFPEIEKQVQRMIARPTWRLLMRQVRDFARQRFRESPDFGWDVTRKSFEECGLVWRGEQLHHAKAMLEHALAPGSDRAWLFLASFSAYLEGALARSEAAYAVGDMIAASEHELRRLLVTLAKMPDSDPHPSGAAPSLLDRTANGLAGSVLRTLITIPYLSILRETIGRTERPRCAA